MLTWGVCAALVKWGHVHLTSVAQILSTERVLNDTFIWSMNSLNSKILFSNHTVPWFDFPLPGSFIFQFYIKLNNNLLFCKNILMPHKSYS